MTGGTPVSVNMTGTADCDLYVRLGAQPTGSTYDCRPYASDSNESCTVTPTSSSQGVYVSVDVYNSTCSFTVNTTVTTSCTSASSP